MTQQDIVDFLRKYERIWFNTNEISEALKVSVSSVNRCLVRMRKRSELNEKRVRIMLKGGRFGGLINKEVSFYSFKRL